MIEPPPEAFVRMGFLLLQDAVAFQLHDPKQTESLLAGARADFYTAQDKNPELVRITIHRSGVYSAAP